MANNVTPPTTPPTADERLKAIEQRLKDKRYAYVFELKADLRWLINHVRALEAELAALCPSRVECPFCGAHYAHAPFSIEPCPACGQTYPEE